MGYMGSPYMDIRKRRQKKRKEWLRPQLCEQVLKRELRKSFLNASQTQMKYLDGSGPRCYLQRMNPEGLTWPSVQKPLTSKTTCFVLFCFFLRSTRSYYSVTQMCQKQRIHMLKAMHETWPLELVDLQQFMLFKNTLKGEK